MAQSIDSSPLIARRLAELAGARSAAVLESTGAPLAPAGPERSRRAPLEPQPSGAPFAGSALCLPCD